MLEDMNKIGSGLKSVVDFDDQLLSLYDKKQYRPHRSSYMHQTLFSIDTYNGLLPKLKTRAGSQFMNQIVAIFAKYNYEVINTTLGFFIIIGTDKGEQKPAKTISILPSIEYKTARVYEPYIRVNVCS